MYVCICNGITDKQIRSAAAEGDKDLLQLQRELGVATGCGSCTETVTELLDECRSRPSIAEPILYRPAAAQAL